MTNRLITLCLSLIFLAGCKSGENYFSEGLNMSSDGDFKNAISKFNEAIITDPFFKDAYLQLGICEEYLNQHDSAIAVYAKLLHLYPKNTAASYYTGVCKYRQKKYDDAIIFYNRALDSKGGFDVADTSSIQALIDMAKDHFESETPEMDIPIREILYDRAMANYEAGHLQKARVDFTNCILQEYNPGSSYYMIGLCHLAKKQRKNARQAFLQASQFGDSLAIKKLKYI